MGKVTAMFAVGAVVTLGGWSTASAASLSVPIETSISGGLAVGDVTELATIATADLAGSTCDVRAVRGDRTAVNRGNDLIVTSGDESTTLTDVEREPGAVTEGEPITLGDTITIVLEIGPDEAFASGLDIEFDCGAAPVALAGEPSAEPTNAAEPEAETETETETEASLPDTGADTDLAALLAALFVVAGGALLVAVRPPVDR